MNVIPVGVEDRWGDIEDNLPMLILWLGIGWTAAAFGEEVFFRGFLVSRSMALFRGVRLAPVFAVFVPALLFGLGHFYYQGLRELVTRSPRGAGRPSERSQRA